MYHELQNGAQRSTNVHSTLNQREQHSLNAVVDLSRARVIYVVFTEHNQKHVDKQLIMLSMWLRQHVVMACRDHWSQAIHHGYKLHKLTIESCCMIMITVRRTSQL